MKSVPLAKIKDDLSGYLRKAEQEEIVITRHGRPAGVLIGFESEDDWFEYRLEHNPEFLKQIQASRAALARGEGTRLEDVDEKKPSKRRRPLTSKSRKRTMARHAVRLEDAISSKDASVDVGFGRTVSSVLAHVLPDVTAKSQAANLVADTILQKTAGDGDLDAAVLEWLVRLFGEAEVKRERRKAVAERAAMAMDSDARLRRMSAGTQDNVPPQDWLSRFWEDASLVCDEALQEIYGRILASEATNPGSFSTRTLGALRYLDKQTMDAFALATATAFDDWIPSDNDTLEACGVDHDCLLGLSEAGLLDSGTTLSRQVTSNAPVFFRWGGLALRTSHAKGLSFRAFRLTSTGRELARITSSRRNEQNFFRLAGWMRSLMPNGKFAWATLPHEAWEGAFEELSWNALSKTPNTR